MARFKYKDTLRSSAVTSRLQFFFLSFFLHNHAFSSARVTVRGMANPIRDFFRGNGGPVRPHNPRLSRDLRMHNACGRETVQGEERAGVREKGRRYASKGN